MGRTASPLNIMESLEGLQYPADASQVLACAKDHKASPEILDLLRDLPQDRQFDNMSELNNVLGKVEEMPDKAMTYQTTSGSQELEDEARLTGGSHH